MPRQNGVAPKLRDEARAQAAASKHRSVAKPAKLTARISGLLDYRSPGRDAAMRDCWTQSIERIRPYSFAAFVLAIACVSGATLLRVAFGWMGVNLPFATYFPAVLVAALLAGIPAGVGVMIASVLIVRWVFIPPYYQFDTLSRTDLANFLIFIASSGLIVVFAQLYRDALHGLRVRDRERDLLMQELEHRGRNTYAVVESIVRNTLVHDPASADAIAGRVRAVSSVNDLINWADSKRASLSALLSVEFAPNEEARLSMSGPDIQVSADAARKLGLVFHELVVNAMKHGALSNAEGHVFVDWRTALGVVHLIWKEKGGPTVEIPQRTGFGTVVILQSLKSLSGGIAFSFDSDGVCCNIEFRSG